MKLREEEQTTRKEAQRVRSTMTSNSRQLPVCWNSSTKLSVKSQAFFRLRANSNARSECETGMKLREEEQTTRKEFYGDNGPSTRLPIRMSSPTSPFHDDLEQSAAPGLLE
jgi:hypothetical protein